MKGGVVAIDVKRPALWIVLGVIWVALVIYLSVASINLPQLPSSFGDKVNHSIAYGFLMIWFGQMLFSTRYCLLLAVCLVGLGMAMEFIQGTLPYRWFDPMDGVANSVGVLFGMVALWCGIGGVFRWTERRLESVNL